VKTIKIPGIGMNAYFCGLIPPVRMLKKSTAFILLLAFFAMTFSRTIIITNFWANQNYIAKILCENRTRPVMRCGGNCYLSKQLKKEDHKDQENPERKMENKFESISIQENQYFIQPTVSFSKMAYKELTENIFNSYQAVLLQPPRV
jgi:hypothetical protein